MITRTSLGRSVLTSVFTTALDFGTMLGLVELIHVNYVVATFVGSIVGFLANFAINRYWAFEAHEGAIGWQFVRVLPVQAGSTGLQTVGVWIFDRFIGLRYWVAKIVVSALVYALWNYPMNRFFVFGRKIEAISESSN
ncbi:MAG: GtrA family protein [Kofleriaceae bacterium]